MGAYIDLGFKASFRRVFFSLALIAGWILIIGILLGILLGLFLKFLGVLTGVTA